MDSSKEILPSHKERTEGCGKSMTVQELRVGNSCFFQNRRLWKEHDSPGARSGEQLLLPGMEEWQVVREVMNAAQGGNGKVS